MIVEVKHYKKSAKQSFLAVFQDYARALPEADIYLVNHGPTGNAVYEVSRSIRDRCHAIQRLTPSGVDARKEFARAVRECVGEPVAASIDMSGSRAGTVLAVDVSASRKGLLNPDDVAAILRHLVVAEQPGELVAVNTRIVETCSPNEAGLGRLIAMSQGSTALSEPICELLERWARVVIITDQDGVATLRGLDVATYPGREDTEDGVCVRICTP